MKGNNKGVLARTFPYYKKEFVWVIYGIVAAFITALTMSLRPQISQLIIDRILNPALGEEAVISESNPFNFLFDGYESNDYMGMLVSAIVALVVVNLCFYLSHYTRWNITHFEMLRGENRMRNYSFLKMLKQGPLTLGGYTSGDLLNITNNDTIAVKDLYLHHIPLVVQGLFQIGFSVFFLMLISPYLVIVPLVMGGASALVSVRYRRILRVKYDNIRRGNVELNTFVQENINGVRIVRAFATENEELKKFTQKNKKFKDNYIDLAKATAKYSMIFSIMGETLKLACLGVGIALSLNGLLSVGQFAIFVNYCTQIRVDIFMLTSQLGNIQNCSVCAERFLEFAERDEELKEPKQPLEMVDSPTIEFRNVGMSFEREKYALKNVSFTLPYGKKLGIMGETGSGKSIIMKLLNRLYDCTEGTITLNGNNLKDYRIDDVRKNYSYVAQDVFLFSESLINNIKFYDENANPQKVEDACKNACVTDYVHLLSDGYETIVGEKGLGLSGGQKQRASIARAFVKDAPILLFDDCTSALDYETERRITDNLFTLYGDRTFVITSHRATTLARCDQIIYLEKGEIAECGTHSELMAKKGKYYEIYVEQENLRNEEVCDG